MFSRDRADLGPAAAADAAARAAAGYTPPRPLDEVSAELWQAWDQQADAELALRQLRPALERALAAEPRVTADRAAEQAAWARSGQAREQLDTARAELAATEQAIDRTAEQIAAQLRVAWDAQRPDAQRDARRIAAGTGPLGRGRENCYRDRPTRDVGSPVAAGRGRPAPALGRTRRIRRSTPRATTPSTSASATTPTPRRSPRIQNTRHTPKRSQRPNSTPVPRPQNGETSTGNAPVTPAPTIALPPPKRSRRCARSCTRANANSSTPNNASPHSEPNQPSSADPTPNAGSLPNMRPGSVTATTNTKQQNSAAPPAS